MITAQSCLIVSKFRIICLLGQFNCVFGFYHVDSITTRHSALCWINIFLRWSFISDGQNIYLRLWAQSMLVFTHRSFIFDWHLSYFVTAPAVYCFCQCWSWGCVCVRSCEFAKYVRHTNLVCLRTCANSSRLRRARSILASFIFVKTFPPETSGGTTHWQIGIWLGIVSLGRFVGTISICLCFRQRWVSCRKSCKTWSMLPGSWRPTSGN